jgi:hypothetical protein
MFSGEHGHPIPGARRKVWCAGGDEGMESLGQGAIRFSHFGDLCEDFAFPVGLALAAFGSLALTRIAARSSAVNPLDALPVMLS